MDHTAPPLSAVKRWLITLTVMIAMFMQVLDMTIANVALPHMQAALGANPESVNWVLTTYILMAAIVTPSTGWLETRIGRRNLFAIAIGGFTVSSAMCGFAASLPMMVVSRALQGMCGALIAPLAQATIIDSSPPEKRAQAMTIFTMGVTIGPIAGPVLGGWLTDSYNWRWVFFINVPIGIVSLIGVMLLIDKVTLKKRQFDLFGFALLAVALGSLQLLLDRGTQQDWFESTEIVIEAGLGLGALWVFVIHILTSKNAILPLALLRERNFVISLVYMMLLMGSVTAGPALIAPMLQVLMGYDTFGAGIMMVPRAIGALISMPLATILIKRVDIRLMIAMGLLITVCAFWIMSGFDLQMDGEQVLLSGLLQGLGSGLAFMPLAIMAFSSIPPQLSTEASVFFGLARNLGGSISLSILGALLAHNLQVNHAELGERITTIRMPLLDSGYIEQFGFRGEMFARMIDLEVNRQAMMIAYVNDYWVMMWSAIVAFPLLFILRKSEGMAKVEIIPE
jgi:drug resistance transporter, EmrB/QacA subfamily